MNGRQTISNAFSQNLFRIPDFQRGYSWTEEQLEDFWTDLEILQEGDRKHYFGVLTVEDGKSRKGYDWGYEAWLVKSGDYTPYLVVDGQQRLTSVLLLLSTILAGRSEDEILNYQTVNNLREKYLYKINPADGTKASLLTYDDNDESAAMLRSLLVDGEPLPSAESTLYNRNLVNAYDFFAKKVQGVDNAGVESLFRRLTNQFVFNWYAVADDFDVHVTFETVNNRGKQLSTLELLKNRLIYLSSLLANNGDSTALRKLVNDCWRKIYSYLGRHAAHPLNDDSFLRAHWVMFFSELNEKPSQYSDHLLKRHFTAPNIRSSKIDGNTIRVYLESLSAAAEPWYRLQVPPTVSGADPEISQWISRLQRLGWGNGEPLALAALMSVSNPAEQAKVMAEIERFVFLVNRLSSRRSDTQQTTFYRLAKDLYASTRSPDRVSRKLREITDGNHGYYRPDGLLEHAKILFRDAEGFYSWNELRYVLYEYERWKQTQANGPQRLSAHDAFDKRLESSVEHILPQTPRDACWTAQFSDKKERKKATHSIGNLVLINRRKNAQLKNGCFDYKCHATKADGTKIGYENGTYSEMELISYGHWDKHTILDRGKRILQFMRNHWEMEIPSEHEEGILLG